MISIKKLLNAFSIKQELAAFEAALESVEQMERELARVRAEAAILRSQYLSLMEQLESVALGPTRCNSERMVPELARAKAEAEFWRQEAEFRGDLCNTIVEQILP